MKKILVLLSLLTISSSAFASESKITCQRKSGNGVPSLSAEFDESYEYIRVIYNSNVGYIGRWADLQSGWVTFRKFRSQNPTTLFLGLLSLDNMEVYLNKTNLRIQIKGENQTFSEYDCK